MVEGDSKRECWDLGDLNMRNKTYNTNKQPSLQARCDELQ